MPKNTTSSINLSQLHSPVLYFSILTLFITPYIGIYDYVLPVTIIITAMLNLKKDEHLGYGAVAVALILPLTAFLNMVVSATFHIIVAPVIMLLVFIYILSEKRMRFQPS